MECISAVDGSLGGWLTVFKHMKLSFCLVVDYLSTRTYHVLNSIGMSKAGLEVSLVLERILLARDEIMGKLSISSGTTFFIHISLP